jgi:hypothetical protein
MIFNGYRLFLPEGAAIHPGPARPSGTTPFDTSCNQRAIKPLTLSPKGGGRGLNESRHLNAKWFDLCSNTT